MHIFNSLYSSPPFHMTQHISFVVLALHSEFPAIRQTSAGGSHVDQASSQPRPHDRGISQWVRSHPSEHKNKRSVGHTYTQISKECLWLLQSGVCVSLLPYSSFISPNLSCFVNSTAKLSTPSPRQTQFVLTWVQINDTFPYWPSINSLRLNCSPKSSLACPIHTWISNANMEYCRITRYFFWYLSSCFSIHNHFYLLCECCCADIRSLPTVPSSTARLMGATIQTQLQFFRYVLATLALLHRYGQKYIKTCWSYRPRQDLQ